MILSVHLLAGAALSPFIPRPLLLAPAAAALHLALDVIPHWEYDFLQSTKTKAAGKIALDIAAGIACALLLLKGASFSQTTLALWGGFFGILPDGFLAIHIFSHEKYLRRFARFHGFFHSLAVPHGTRPPVLLGVFTQITVVALSFLALSLR